MAKRRVVITGLGVVTALGESVPLFWDNICAGRSGVRRISCFSTEGYRVRIGGEIIDAQQIDLVSRIMSMGTLHKSYAVSGGVCTAGAAMIPGTVVHDLLKPEARGKEMLKIGHPGGVIEVGALMEKVNGETWYREAILGRTARRLMEGYVLVPEKTFKTG